MLSFSTMWAQQDRFEDLDRFRSVVAGFGYEGIEVSHSTPEQGLQTLLTPGEVPLTSLHAPTPRRLLPDGRLNGDANLADADEDKRRYAVAETLRTVEYAAEAGLRYVVVHLGCSLSVPLISKASVFPFASRTMKSGMYRRRDPCQR